ncbi:MAG: DMT family transporter [Deltaproteobacteria bacterium]|nr:DMT family transporter [Deltaproteobacteria bacterium]
MQNDEMTLKAFALAVFLCCIFGANAVAIKFSLTGLGAFTAAGIRFAIAAVVILTWTWYRKISLGLTGKQLRQMLMLSALFIVQFTCFYNGLEKTTASHGVLISNLLPFGVLILAHCFIPGERVFFKKGVGIIFGFITWNTLLKRFGASSLHSFIFIMPLAGVLASVLLLRESVASFLAASVAFIVTGIIIVNLKIRKRPV